MFTLMKRNISLVLLGLFVAFGFSSCMDDSERQPVGPVSDSTKIPWNTQIPGQGQGQFGQLPQSQYRR